MKTLMKLPLLLALLIAAASCGSKGQTQSSFSLTLGATVSGATPYGGVVIAGRKTDDSQHIQLGFMPGEVMDVVLENGQWEFAAISWEGESSLPTAQQVFTGEHNCGYVGPVNLNGGDIDINFTLNPANCTSSLPNGEKFSSYFRVSPSDEFKKVHVRTCDALPGTLSAASCTAANGDKGLSKSYRVLFGSFNADANVTKALETTCYDISDQEALASSHYLQIPVGDSSGSIFSFSIVSYSDAGCTGDAVFYPFDNGGIFAGSTESNKATRLDDGLADNDSILLLLEHNQFTPGQSVNSFFGTGTAITSTSTSITLDGTYYARITNISSTNIITVTGGITVSAGDEVMWLVNEKGAAGNCGTFEPGLFGENRVVAVSGSVITLSRPINDYILNDGSIETLTMPDNTDLAASTGSSNYCSIQLVKAKTYESLTLSSASNVAFSPAAYSKSNGYGGVLMTKINNLLHLTGGGDHIIDALGKGRVPGEVYSYSACPVNKRCAYIGNEDGGGVAILAARHVKIDGGSNFEIKTSGSGGSIGGNGGSVILMADALEGTGNFEIHADGGTGSTQGGDSGVVTYNYCLGHSGAFSGSLNVFATGGSGTTAGITHSVNSDTNFCPL